MTINISIIVRTYNEEKYLPYLLNKIRTQSLYEQTETIIVDSGSTDSDVLNVTGNVKATAFIGPLTGNATTATTLETARNIGGISFNGSENILPCRSR